MRVNLLLSVGDHCNMKRVKQAIFCANPTRLFAWCSTGIVFPFLRLSGQTVSKWRYSSNRFVRRKCMEKHAIIYINKALSARWCIEYILHSVNLDKKQS